MRGRDRRLEVPGVHDPAPDPHGCLGPGQPGYEPVLAGVGPLGHPEEPDPARRQQLLIEHPLVVVADLDRRRAGVIASVRAGLLELIVAQATGVHAVQGRRGVQPHERVRVVPVAARAMAPVDHNHVGVAGRDQRIDERHSGGARPYDQVVGLDRVHGEILRPGRARGLAR